MTPARATRWLNHITRIYTEIYSQPGRFFNDFRNLGFNEDDCGRIGRKVFDGHMQWISVGSGIGMNYRFSQSGRTERNRQDHLYAENLFPFANVRTTDPFTGITASRYDACQMTNTCAFGVEIYSANEYWYWVKTASLVHTQPDGSAGLPDSPFTRNYFMSSIQHGTGNATNRGACQQFGNPLNSAPVQRTPGWKLQGRKSPWPRRLHKRQGCALRRTIRQRQAGRIEDRRLSFNAGAAHLLRLRPRSAMMHSVGGANGRVTRFQPVGALAAVK